MNALSPRHRLLVAVVCLAPALGCVSFCGEDGAEPVLARCDTTDTEFDIDAIEVEAFQSYGGQGTVMVMFDVRYLGADPPTCVELAYTVRDLEMDGFPAVLGATEQIETEERRPGLRETTSPVWQAWPDGARLLAVEVTSHGRTGVGYVCQSGTLACEELDGGLSLDAGPSPEAGDAGVGDSGI